MAKHPERKSVRFIVHCDSDDTPRSWSVAALHFDGQGVPDARLLAYGSLTEQQVPEGIEALAYLVHRAASQLA